MLEMRRGGLCGAIRVIPNWVLRFLFQWPEAGVEEDKALLIKLFSIRSLICKMELLFLSYAHSCRFVQALNTGREGRKAEPPTLTHH